jgi:hypothetical protein
VKDIAQSLVDDGEINLDKIGTSNYYWSFPSQDLIQKKNVINSLKEEVVAGKRKRKELESEQASLLIGREETVCYLLTFAGSSSMSFINSKNERQKWLDWKKCAHTIKSCDWSCRNSQSSTRKSLSI